LFIGIALAICAQFVFTRTARGYAISETGANPQFAEYGGVNVLRQGFFVLLASGAVGGLAGGIEALGVHRRFMEGFAPGFGFDGVIAALLANGSPIGTIGTALFFGALRNGSLLLEVDTTASREIITVIQALIILAVSAEVKLRRGALDSSAGERRWKF
jgi:simple sugar transport system permease protein